MDNDTGYKGWRYEPLNADEQAMADKTQADLNGIIRRSGYDPTIPDRLTITFRKATLTISPEEARTGAGHGFADGQPFYRLTMQVKGKSLQDHNDQAVKLSFHMMQAFGNFSMGFEEPFTMVHDFRGDIYNKRVDMILLLARLHKYVVNAPKP